MPKLILTLSNFELVRLERVTFARSQHHPIITSSRNGNNAPQSDNRFTWTAAVRALTLLSIRTRLSEESEPFSLVGHELSAAASLDYAISKEPGWLVDFFGMTEQGKPYAKQLFLRRNSERKRPGPVEICFNRQKLLPTDIQIFLNDQEVTASEVLKSLCENLESQAALEVSQMRTRRRMSDSVQAPNAITENTGPQIVTANLKLDIDPRKGLAGYSFTCRVRNTRSEPMDFIHWSIVRNPTRPSENFVARSLGRELQASKVGETQTLERYLIHFATPIPFGTEREIEVYYEQKHYTEQSGRLHYLVNMPTEYLSLELRCDEDFKIGRHAIIADRDEETLFSELPSPVVENDANSASFIRWSMHNPPQGYRYRLYWAIEERAEKSNVIASTHRETRLSAANPKVLN